MKQRHDTLEIATTGPGLTDITGEVESCVRTSGVACGACTVLVLHTSASLLIQENADPAVGRDLVRALSRLAPEDAPWEHDAEGPDDMPAHVKAALTSTSLSIPVLDGALRLGTWQGIFLVEHRRRGSRRSVAVHVIGE